MKIRHLALIIIGALLISSFQKKKELDKPNLIFILVDDLGKEWISCYGAENIETKRIDALAENGIKFSNVYSMPQCTPSRVALMTGQYPYENGWVDHFDVPRWGHETRFDPFKNPVFAQELRKNGYKTCIAGKWQINDFRIEPEAVVNAGFDEYCMWTGAEGGDNVKKSGSRYWNPYIHTKSGSQTYENQFGPDIFSDFIINFMEENRDDPMCIYYPMVLTHAPFVHTPHEPNAKTTIEKHEAMLRYTDYIIGKIVDAVDSLKLTDNTYLVFTTDNGTSPKIIGAKDGVFIKGGKGFLSQNGIDAPFIVKTPHKAQVNKVSDALVDFTDVFPTFLDLAGIDRQEKNELNGKSFASVLRGKSETGEREWNLAMGSHPAGIDKNGKIKNYNTFRDRVLYDGKYKIYVDTLQVIYRIFDLENDPYEHKNLILETGEVENVLAKYQPIVDNLPDEDNQPKYKKSGKSYYDIPVNKINNISKKGHIQMRNMLPLVTKEQYLKQWKKKK
ncbi:MAG: sulfatase-like hydrolase/transferase [Bacteroidota bacterium]